MVVAVDADVLKDLLVAQFDRSRLQVSAGTRGQGLLDGRWADRAGQALDELLELALGQGADEAVDRPPALEGEDLSVLFGIDLGDPPLPGPGK